MIETKREIILEEGVPVKVYKPNYEVVTETIALIGKATRQVFSEVSLESHRQGQFFPELPITNGLLVENLVTNEVYIIIANYPEVMEQQKCTTITRMILCNSNITVSGLVETADRFGNIKKEFKPIYKDLAVYVDTIDGDVEQTDAGKFPKKACKIYAPNIHLNIVDRLEVDVGGEKELFKIASSDPLKFRGITIIDAVTDTRR